MKEPNFVQITVRNPLVPTECPSRGSGGAPRPVYDAGPVGPFKADFGDMR